MKIFVTNLPRSTDRRLFMEKQFDKLKMEFEFVNCVIGATLTEEEISQSCNTEAIEQHNSKINWFNKGIIGCTMTNQNTYKRMIAEDIDVALLLEDDTVLPKDLKNIVEEIKQQIKPGDVVLLFFMSWVPLILNKSEIIPTATYKLYKPINPEVISGGSAMIVTKEAAAKMLAQNTPIHTTPDCWGYFFEHKCIDRLLCLYPLKIDTADFKSTMQLGQLKKISNLINQYKLFPFYQMLKMRRKHLKKQKQIVRFQ